MSSTEEWLKDLKAKQAKDEGKVALNYSEGM